MPVLQRVLIFAFALLAWAGAHAQAGDAAAAPGWRLGGFGTVGAVYHDGPDDLEYRRTINAASGARGGELDFGVDTLLGLQLDGRLGPVLDLALQAVSRRNADDAWTPELTWAFLRYQRDDALALRLGRLGIEIYPLADSRLVGYALLPVRPPIELYANVFTDSYDGADITLQTLVEDTVLRAKLSVGRAGGSAVDLGDGKLDLSGSTLVAGYAEALWRGWQTRLSLGRVRLAEDLPDSDLYRELRALGASGRSLAARLSLRNTELRFLSLSLAYDRGPWQFVLMAGRVLSDDALLTPDTHAAYLILGRRFGPVTPYLMLSAIKGDSALEQIGDPRIDPPLREAQYDARSNQTSTALGLRYELGPSSALKLQVDRVRFDDAAVLLDRATPVRRNDALTVFSLTLDFVF